MRWVVAQNLPYDESLSELIAAIQEATAIAQKIQQELPSEVLKKLNEDMKIARKKLRPLRHLPFGYSHSHNGALRCALDIARVLRACGYRILRGAGIEFFVRFGLGFCFQGGRKNKRCGIS